MAEVTPQEHRHILGASLGSGFALLLTAAFGDLWWWFVPVGIVIAYILGWALYGLRRILKRPSS